MDTGLKRGREIQVDADWVSTALLGFLGVTWFVGVSINAYWIAHNQFTSINVTWHTYVLLPVCIYIGVIAWKRQRLLSVFAFFVGGQFGADTALKQFAPALLATRSVMISDRLTTLGINLLAFVWTLVWFKRHVKIVETTQNDEAASHES